LTGDTTTSLLDTVADTVEGVDLELADMEIAVAQLEAIPPMQHDLALVRESLERSLHDIAKEQGISRQAVGNKVIKARNRLARVIYRQRELVA
jgi:DNA-directed RNA polymerase specialized sigma24 family protein